MLKSIPNSLHPSRYKTPFYRRLYIQLILLSAVVLAVSVLIFTTYTVREQSATAREAVIIQSSTLTRNLGNAAGNYIVGQDFSIIEELLLQAATYREVIDIRVTDERGIVLGHVQREQDRVEVKFDVSSITLPQKDALFIEDFDTYIVLWYPIENGTVGWVRLAYSLAAVEQLVDQIWLNGILAGLGTFLVSIILLSFILKRPIRSIENATNFASRLYKSTGETIPIERSTYEVEQLEYALNYAATRLYRINKDLSDMKFALDAHAIVGITDQEGHITYANDRFCEISGYSRGELLGQTYKLLNSNHHDKTYYDSLWKTVAGGRVWHGEIRDKRKDGGLYWVETTIVPFVDDNGVPYQYISIQTDISERKQAESKLHEYQEHLEDMVEDRTNELQLANRELESFCYSVSHDLRAPLRSIDGFSQALLEDFSDILDAKAMDFLGRVRGASQRMSELIDDLLKLSRVVRSEIIKVDVNLSQVACEVIYALRSAEPARSIDVVVQPDLMVKGDKRLLQAMMENLLGNAWKFTNRHVDPRIEFGIETHDGKTIYYVRDNGAGFEQSYAHKLFEPFQRLHSVKEFEGSGIGLATVNRIVRRHGGEIWAKGEVGRGATFYFTLE